MQSGKVLDKRGHKVAIVKIYAKFNLTNILHVRVRGEECLQEGLIN